MWFAGDRTPRLQGFVSVGSRRYMEWQDLALQATNDDARWQNRLGHCLSPWSSAPSTRRREPSCEGRIQHASRPPRSDHPEGGGGRQDKSSLDPTEQPNTKDTVAPARVSEARRQNPVQRSSPDPDGMVTGERSRDPDPGDDQLKGDDNQNPDQAIGDLLALLNSMPDLGFSSATQDPERARNPAVGEETVLVVAVSGGNHSETGNGPPNSGSIGETKTPDPADLRVLVDGQRKPVVDSHRERDQAPGPTDTLDPEPDDSTADEQVCYHERGDLYAEDVATEMAVLPEVTSTTEAGTIEDIQVGIQILTHLKK
ncbi:unnamed protein product [Phytophthora fragariaefolia]|uniref:Unnamed protein product n=1 Tax=Phytophthora fragariaefolia TaxID=1490495 RepID=A0A9W6WPD8_9STRA|nr:unnamed protein product [Phytophthora fragariaefolia]